MKREKLRAWYCKMLERSKAEGTTQRYGSMLEEFRDISSAREIPMFKGDQWEVTVPALLQEEDGAGGDGDAPDTPREGEGGGGGGGSGGSGGGGGFDLHRTSSNASVGSAALAPKSPVQPRRTLSRDTSGSALGGTLDEQLQRMDATASFMSDDMGMGGAIVGREGGRSQRLKGLPMCKSVSLDLVSKVMRRQRPTRMAPTAPAPRSDVPPSTPSPISVVLLTASPPPPLPSPCASPPPLSPPRSAPQVHKQMRRLQGHFLIAALSPLRDDELAAAAKWEAEPEPLISHDVVNTRQVLTPLPPPTPAHPNPHLPRVGVRSRR